jgi:hypothetical protein
MKASIKNGGKTVLLGGVGGLLAAGLKMFIDPLLFKDQSKMVKFCWVSPAAEAVLGGIGGAFDKTAMAGAGLSGAAVAHLVENVGMAISIKKNSASAPATTQGYDAGALVMPRELAGFSGPSLNTAGMSGPSFSHVAYRDDTGALVMPSHR